MAHEMQRLGMTQPLLIGGATTSRVHTAVKIAPNYGGVTVYVPDASRAVGVASNLLSDELKDGYVAEVAADYEKIRVQHAGKKGPPLISLAAARANALRPTGAHYVAAAAGADRPARNPPRRPGRARPIHRLGARSSRPGSCPVRIRRSSTIRSSARRRATCWPTARRC